MSENDNGIFSSQIYLLNFYRGLDRFVILRHSTQHKSSKCFISMRLNGKCQSKLATFTSDLKGAFNPEMMHRNNETPARNLLCENS